MHPSATSVVMAAVLASMAGLPAARAATVEIGGHAFVVEIASTPAARETGLMKRHHLAANAGMWFVFEKSARRSFWMKDTPLALDMLFFDADHRLVSMQVNVPSCRVERCPLYPSGEPAKYVLEVAAGTAWRLQLRVGDAATVKSAAHATR